MHYMMMPTRLGHGRVAFINFAAKVEQRSEPVGSWAA